MLSILQGGTAVTNELMDAYEQRIKELSGSLEIGRTLFECLMNRIYNVSDFERLGAMTDRERQAIDKWLQLTERENNAG